MIDFQLVVQHRDAGVLTSTNFNLDALVGQPTVSIIAPPGTTSYALPYRPADDCGTQEKFAPFPTKKSRNHY
jgi:hypothetical protein